MSTAATTLVVVCNDLTASGIDVSNPSVRDTLGDCDFWCYYHTKWPTPGQWPPGADQYILVAHPSDWDAAQAYATANGGLAVPPISDTSTAVGATFSGAEIPAAAGVAATDNAFSACEKLFAFCGWKPVDPHEM